MGSHRGIGDLVKLLKIKHTGDRIERALSERLEIQIENPLSDPMIAQVWDGYQALPGLLKEPFSVLDCGCMCGYLYYFLRQHFRDFQYIGVDKWPEAIRVAKARFPEAEFVEADFDTAGFRRHDYVILSNLPWKERQYLATARYLAKWFADRSVVVIYPDSKIHIEPGIS